MDNLGHVYYTKAYLVECQPIPSIDNPSIAQLTLNQQSINILVDSWWRVNWFADMLLSAERDIDRGSIKGMDKHSFCALRLTVHKARVRTVLESPSIL